ncbi:MAG: hypothetical protein MUF01_12670 [Bryobacterales bacterium]|jgi:response regulator RpfG family c-di-GMP phosphodiesterase|nr:hypothetical protein [Bryobacterales bacterium]
MIQDRFFLHAAPSAVQGLARVLSIDADAASRMTMRIVLEAVGYSVSQAVTTVQAMELLDSNEFELVLCNSLSAPDQIDEAVLSYARFQDYEPATAVVTSILCAANGSDAVGSTQTAGSQRLLVEPQNLPDLLEKIADLVAERALSRLERELAA